MKIEEAKEILQNHLLCLSGKMVSKPKQKDVIEALEIAVHKISQLIPTDNDVMQACIDQVKDSGFDFGYINPKFTPSIGEMHEIIKIKNYYCNSESILEGRCDNQCSWCQTHQRKNNL